ncbi:thiolase-like protein [Rhizoclosmatium globosum]|uniref:Thiolase-like protein n=1 Tax=Rhizoclosmatium globosum TaxID=329046 RepID=A0A1Y2CL77_9FUNG|nr:thiolase-like protein [Rhizoclosmatium globosum]|eukprot:ORY47772.1 thiolase-like protein [Rhizoclosmatium globosum]
MSASLQLDVFSLFETQPGDLLLRPTSVTVASTAPNPSTTTRRRTLRLRVPVFVVGVGCTKFLRPLSHSKEYHQLAKEAAAKALEDSRIPYAQVKAAVASYCYGDPSSGQRAMYELGMTGIPIFNCNSYCSSGSSAIMLGKNLVQSGNTINPGKLSNGERDGCIPCIAHKNHKQSQWNPNALLTKQISIEDIKNPAKSIGDPLTTAMSAPTADGAAALHGLQHNAVEILGQEMETDSLQTLQGGYNDVVEYTGITPQDIDVLEVHDCFASAELFMYEALGLAGPGEGAKLIESAEWIKSRGGIGETALLGNRWVVNPSGGLESKGHPIGASGVAQAVELSLQLRGDAGNRQILFRDPRKRVGLQHNYGLGSACVVTLYGKFDATDKSEEVSKL